MMKEMKLKRPILCLAVLLFLATPCVAAPTDATPTRETYFPADYRPAPPPPEDGSIIKYAKDGEEGAQRNFGVQLVHDNQFFATFKFDRFEYQWREGDEEVAVWDAKGWVGNDDHKLYLETEGEYVRNADELEEAVTELLYTRTLSTFCDWQAGVRYDFRPKPERVFFAVGMQGLAPQWFEVDATAYLSEDGDLSAAIEIEYELMLTQRLVLVPRLEAGFSAHDVPEYETWQGITDVTVGARLLYQISRKFAPYVGGTWSRSVGETGSRLKNNGADIDSAGVVAGVKFWF